MADTTVGGNGGGGKSLRKRLQRQLEFYLSTSNLRQDKFLQQHMDEDGFLPVALFLSFRRLQAIRATERLIMEAAEKSRVIRTDSVRRAIAPMESALAQDDADNCDERTIYVEGFPVNHDHDSLRKVYARFGKVNLVSMPRFQQSRRFKGFAFVEFAAPDSVDRALGAIAEAAKDGQVDADSQVLRGMRAMRKTAWLEMKEKLKHKLMEGAATTSGGGGGGGGGGDGGGGSGSGDRKPAGKHQVDTKYKVAVEATAPRSEQRSRVTGHIHFRDEDEEEEEEEEEKVGGQKEKDTRKEDDAAHSDSSKRARTKE